MDDHVIQQNHPASEVIAEEQKVEASPYLNVENGQVDAYRDFVVHYFDNQMNRDILMLPQSDKDRLFQMLTDYADVLEKIFHPGVPILEHILGKRWAAAQANPHPGINYDYDCPIIREYETWKDVQKAKEQVQQPEV
jgi:hypothetical protein